MPFAGVFGFICHHSKLEWITYMISLFLRILFGVSKYKGIYRCMFIGEEKDTFHFAIYF